MSMLLAKGGPPDTPWETFTYWWGSTIIGWDGPTWGSVIVVAAIGLAIWWAAVDGRR